MVVRPRPNPETIAALLDTTWRIADAERARTENLDRKASTLAPFAALVLSLSAGLEPELLGSLGTPWAFALYVAGLVALLASAALAVRVLWPKEEFAFRMAYLERFPSWSQLRRTAEDVRGDTILGLIEVIAGERARNQRKARQVRVAFALLLAGLSLVVVEASILGARTIR